MSLCEYLSRSLAGAPLMFLRPWQRTKLQDLQESSLRGARTVRGVNSKPTGEDGMNSRRKASSAIIACQGRHAAGLTIAISSVLQP